MTDFERMREAMVERQLAARGIRDPAVLDAMRGVPRERFIPPQLAGRAYDDGALPIDAGQTISQPYIVALMIEAAGIGAGSRVLEVGAGSGYAAAVIARIAKEVVAIERIAELAEGARERLASLGCANVRVICADGSKGWPAAAPYDAILVAATAATVPAALVNQLKRDGGRLVIPVGGKPWGETLLRVTRDGDSVRQEPLCDVRFVPLIED
jgi:protein-L-isoaspartate(D-aspartate) O-methyltransferase